MCISIFIQSYVNGKLRVSTLLSTINSLLLSHIHHRRMGHAFRFLLPPFLYYPPPLFSKFSYKSFLFQNYSWRMTSTDIVKWRKNEWLWTFWKRNDLYENFEKKGGGVVEKRGRRKRNPCPMRLWHTLQKYMLDVYCDILANLD